MAKDNLSISVIIATLNRSELLKDTLDSLTRQSRQPDEVIVVDNGSTDKTREVVSSFNNRLKIKYVFEEVRGIPYARNTGVRNATGDIIASIDDDCVADEDWLKYIEIPFIRDPNIGIVGGELYNLEKSGSILEEFHKRCMS